MSEHRGSLEFVDRIVMGGKILAVTRDSDVYEWGALERAWVRLQRTADQREPEWDEAAWTVTTRFGSVELRSQSEVNLFSALWKYRGRHGLTVQRLIDILYANDADGGVWPPAIWMAVKRLRETLAPGGGVIYRGWSGGGGYSLDFITPAEASEHKSRRYAR